MEQKDALDSIVKCLQQPKRSAYPSPGNILHTGKQLPRTPGPGILPLLPSQAFDPFQGDLFEELFKSIAQSCVSGVDNIIPCGKQLSRTPILKSSQETIAECNYPNKKQFLDKNSIENVAHISNASIPVEKSEKQLNGEVTDRETITKSCIEKQYLEPRLSETARDQKNVVSEYVMNTNEIDSGAKAPGCRNTFTRRISELPVQGLNKIRISGVLKKMPGYECHSEDLEFLKHMEYLEKARGLKAELLCLRKGLTAANQEKELLVAKKIKVELDIQKMKESFEKVVELGRSFLCRTQDTDSVKDLAPQDVLKMLNPTMVQQVQGQQISRLLVMRKELKKKQMAVNRTNKLCDKFSLKPETYKDPKKDVESHLQHLSEEIDDLKNTVQKAKADLGATEEIIQKKKDQITRELNRTPVSKQNSDMSEAEQKKLNRRLKRIVHRKDLFIEREKILQRLKLSI
ncbi:uncharacterized protein LOC128653018 [Bombina bombina]|uniref:uncharacterized protein LOC128653018 n=1 Tax=Bombina bombina TaxID=8345 RepID=UPI00235B1506|nr:uncharacterized protein LOC128653018 [Bombina bombina]